MNPDFDFNKHVIEESFNQPVIVEFSSPGCGPCLWMEKTLIEVVKEMNQKMHFVSLLVKDHLEFAGQYNIRSNPTTILFVKGKPIAQLTGALPKIAIKQWLRDHTMKG